MPESTKEGATGLPEGSDIGLGPGDRAFEPHYSDQNPSEIVDFRGIFLFFVYCGAGGEDGKRIITNTGTHSHFLIEKGEYLWYY